MVETELEKYEEYGPLIMHGLNTAAKIMPLQDRATSAYEQIVSTKSVENETIFKLETPFVNEIKKEEELIEISEETKIIECKLDPMKVIEKNLAEAKAKVKADKCCQSEDNLSDNLKIKELHNLIIQLKLDFDHEKKNLSYTIDDYSLKEKKMTETIENLENSLAVSNEKYSDSEKSILNLTQENSELHPLKQKVDLLQVENEQLFGELRTRQADVEDANNKFLDLTKSLNQSMRIIDDQKTLINDLEAENERHRREKHLACEQKIKELFSKCEELNEKLNSRIDQVEKLSASNSELEKQVERYKTDLKIFNFKEFVSMKRELNSLKQEKERHFASIVTMPNAKVDAVLPPIKDKEKKNSFQFF